MNKTLTTLQQLSRVLGFYLRFLISFTQIGYLVRRTAWIPPVIADFRGQHWFVTGGSGGLGKAMVLAALRAGATVTAAARSASKLRDLQDEASARGFAGLDTECCDFTSVADVDALIARLASKNRRIDVLMNNVGVLNDELIVTSEGFEASFVSNLLSHYQLTQALIEKGLLSTGSAIINMTSGGGYHFPLVTALLDVKDPKRYNGVVAYGCHKRAQITLNAFWRNQYRDRGIEFFVTHPGWVDTAGVRRSLPRFRKMLKSILRDAESGADTAIWLAAVRPRQPDKELVWFDRRMRAAHIYRHTRRPPDSATALVKYLDRQLAAARAQ